MINGSLSFFNRPISKSLQMTLAADADLTGQFLIEELQLNKGKSLR
jgi:hypothetical protein